MGYDRYVTSWLCISYHQIIIDYIVSYVPDYNVINTTMLYMEQIWNPVMNITRRQYDANFYKHMVFLDMK